MTNSMLTLKENGQVTQLAQEGVLPERIILEGPSVVTLPVGPEAVLRYDRVGLDLVLVLADGSRITIVNFFVTGPDDARNDIVFVDGNEVMWWGQYTQPWQGFQIAEIEPGAVPGAFGFFGPGLLAGLAGGGALIAGGGGDDGGNNPPVATDDAGSVREAGVQAGGNAGDPGVAQASGNVLTNDSDIDGGTLVVTGVALAGGGSAAPGDVLVGVHGDLTLGSDGVWTYVLDNGRGATEGLALGQTAQEVFTYTVSDGQGGTAVADLVVTVTGTNDLPVIDAAASTLSGAVTEAGRADGGVPGASGQLVWSDPDAGAETRWSLATPADSRFGSFTVDAVTGEWAYVLDNSAAATQGLTAGQTETLTFDLRVTDEHGASAVTQVTVVVTGADDAAVITGPATGSVTEAGGRDNAAPGQPVTGGQLVVSDPDAGQSVFQTPDAGDLAGVYGQFSFNPATGVWSYALDNDRAATQALNAGETATETLVVTSADGLTSETITVTVTGSNDAATITGDVTGGVTEDDQPDTLTTTGSLTVTDPDAGQSLIAPGSLAFAGASHGGAGALGTLVIDAAGNWSYAIDNTLAAVQSLAEGASFTERWTVASLDGTASTTITVTVTGTNDDPVIAGQASGDVVEDGRQSVQGQLTVSDVDLGDSHVWSVPTPGEAQYGALTVDPSGRWTYVLDNNLPAVQALKAGETRVDAITVRVTDSAGGWDDQVVTITVTGTNDAPVAVADTGVTPEDTVLDVGGAGSAGNLLANDSDALVVQSVAGGQPVPAGGATVAGSAGGVFTIYPDGSYRFDPDGAFADLGPGDSRPSTVTYTVSDGQGGTSTAELTVTVTGVNDAPVATDDAGSVREAGVQAGGNAGDPGVAQASGNVLTNDSDIDGGTLVVTGVALAGGGSAAPGDVLVGVHGDLTLGSDGVWTYVLDNGRGATEGLALGQTAQEVFTYTVSDGQGGTAVADLVVTVTGTNDLPVIDAAASTLSGAVTEAGRADGGVPGASGQLVWSDPDAGAETRWSLATPADSRFGSFTVDAVTGEWAYVLDNSAAATQGLTAGQTETLTFDLRVTDEHGASAVTQVTVVVTGADDAAVITGPATGSVTEAGGRDNAAPGQPVTGGQLVVSDPDAGQSVFQTPDAGDLAGVYGQFSFNPATGVWSYALDNDRAATQALNAGETATETLVVTSADGLTSETITVTVTGSNDAATITGDVTGGVTEDDQPDTLTTTGSLTVTDPDAGQSLIAPGSLAFAGASHGGAGALGTLVIDAAGNWSYAIDNTLAAVQSLAEGASFTERWTVASLDGTASTTITVTVTGTNDDPVIGANSDLTASVTELADGAAGENSFEHGRTGFIHFTDVDLLDTQHEVTVVPQGAGYLGDFTWTDINDVSDRLQWQFTVNDAVLDSLPAGESLEQVYEVTITDPNGGTATTEVTVTIQGRNDRPVPQADQSLTEADMPVSANVVANDSDVDAGETATLQVTQVAGVPVVAGGAAVEVFDGGQLLGTVSLTGRGDLTFTPAAGVIGRVDLPYTVDDGSGTVNATAIGTWTVNVIGVDIVDDTSPGTPGTGDNVLASIDDLGAVEILGQAPVDGTVTGLTVSDGVNPSVVIDPAQIILNPDGSFTVTADLSGLDDGMLTVSMEVSDGTNSITTTDEILKDTVTEVVIDPVLIVEGETPVITGTAEAGATVTLTVNGEEYETVADGNGDWSVTLDAPLDGDGVFITADAEDIWGNTDTNTREVSGLTLFDTDPGDPAHVVVHEAGLAGGTTPGDGRDRVESTLIIAGGASDLDRLVFGGSIVGGAVVGGTTVTAAELAAATIVDPVDILTDHGTISITAYDASLGIISYTYTLNGAITHDAAEGEGGIIRETIQIAVVETDGDIRAGNLVAAVVDDAPLDPVGEAPVGVIENEGPISGNVLSNDSATLGADGGRLHDITFTNRAGLSQTEEIPEGGPVTVETQYGELTISSDGFWTFTPVASANHVQPGNDAQLQDGFTYRTIDGDGDISAASANQPIVVLDTFAELGDPTDQTINESALPSGSAPDAPGQTVTGTLDVIPGADTFRVRFDIAQTAPVGQTAGGEQLEYVVSGGADANILTAYAGPGRTEADRIFVVTITDPTAANAGYSFQLLRPLDHLPDPVTGDTPDIDLGFDVIVTDSDGDSDAAMFNVTVVDDPQSDTLAFTITEDGSQNFNTSADASGDNTVIRDEAGTAITGMPVAGGTSYALPNGVAVVHPDGSVTYTPAPNFSGTEVFEFATTENGVTSVTTVTMTVDPVADAPVVTADAAAINTLEDTAVALGLNAPVIADDGTGAGNNTQSERLGTITLSGLPEGAVLQSGGITHTVLAGGTVTIVLSDMDTITGATGTLTMTSAEFEALTVLPPPHRHENFTVTMSVTSFEVDGSGTPVGLGATATTDVDVNVLAVTDEVALTFVGGTIEETFTINEDSTLDVTAQLLAAFDDIDGSELRSFTVINGSGGLIVVNGVTVPLGGEFEIPAPLLSNGTAGIPPIAIGALSNFSGDLNGITVRLNAQDRDGDSPSATPATETDSVTLNLRVNPVAGDVVAGNVTTTEDTAVAFLQDLRVTDTSIGAGGTEVITQVAFEVPAGWSMSSPPNNGTWTVDLIGDLYTIDFNGGTRAEREAVLDGFTITPPNHSSADVTISLSVTTEDSATVNGAPEVSTEVTTLPVTITVTPVAELVGGDSDGNATPDLTMTLGHIYSSGITGEEDEWFALNADGFDLSAGWTNEDTDEATFALLTPVLVEGDSATTSAIGSRFSWIDPVDGPQEVVFNGTPVEIPVAALGSVQFMAPEDASGEFRIGVQTRTVDPDADDPATTVTADSGQAWLDGIVILPVADDVTLNIRARASGPEDTEIPLAIRPSSSDLSETFNVTIADIPVDAVLRYDGNILDTSSGSVTILDFDQTLPLTIQPPLHSNVDFPLTITAESIDRLTGYPDAIPATSDPLTIVVEVIGVADPAIISLPSAVPEYIEADLDNGTPVLLSDLFTANRVDLDGSETLTMRVTGLPDGYALNQGTLVSNSSITGEDRIWVLNAAQLATAGIIAPVNANGEVVFSVTPVTTENDGNSRTGAPVDVRFTIAPSPEAEVTTSALMVEDEWRPLAIAIQHVNGDTDEVLEAIRIPVDLGAVSFTLSMNDGGSRLDLQDAGLTTVTEGGVEYYLIPGDRIAELEALPDPHLDGDLGGFDFQYQIRDPSNTPGTVDDGLLWKDGSFTLDALAVTDAPSLALVGFTGDFEPAGPNGILLNAPGRIGVDLNLSTPDADGSEKLVRILVENVPDGVTVEDTDGMQAELIGPGTWLLVYQGAEAQAITGGSLPQEVVFVVGPNAGSSEPGGIRITTQVQDNGEQGDPGTLIEQALVSFDLQTSFIGGDGEDPATIEEWSQNAFTATEDVTFTLADVMNAEVTQNSTEPNILTVTLTGLPAGTDITGMTRTVIEGVEVWSASTVTMTGGDAQAALDALLAGITITSPANVNSGNTGSPLPFDAQLTTAVVGSAGQDSQTAAVDIPVAPVTDPVDLTVALDGVPELTETATTIPLAITVANPADGANGVIENGNLYLQIDSGQAGLATGELTDALGNVIEPQTGSDISGLPAGLNPAATYYVVPGVTMGDTVQLVYTPDEMEAGAVTVTGWVENSETGSVTLLGDGSATFPVAISNNGVQVTAPPVTGAEAADIDPASQIELTGAGGLDFALIDNDGSEVIETIMLSNLPDGFLVFTGTSAGDASSAPMASNAGGASGLNTWVLYSADDGGSLPGYIAILPPKNWSGTLSDLSLLVTSGETTLTEKRTEEFEMGDITVEPVANGLTLIGTSSFGTEGSIIPLNLNAGVLDASAAVVSPLAPDETPGEAVTLQLTGLGEFASFYIGTTLRSAGVSYDEGSDTYTLTGLSQTDLDALGVLQAAPAAGTVRTITATAWTVDGADTSASATTSFTQNTTRQISTTGADTLLWNGRDINGRAGEDTVRFRLGEDLEGSTLAARLRGIEVLDLQIAGSNAITDLTPDQVRQITSGGNTLKVLGTAEDLVGLDGNWTETAPGLYSGTISSGGAPVTVTLEVTGASVTLPPAPFMMMFADPGEEDGLAFGFAALEAEPEAASTGAEPMDAEEIDMTGMLETGESEDLADLLPPEDPPAETTGPASGGREPAPADLSDPDLLRMTLEDELNASALAEA